jgi:hypothetical protein
MKAQSIADTKRQSMNRDADIAIVLGESLSIRKQQWREEQYYYY